MPLLQDVLLLREMLHLHEHVLESAIALAIALAKAMGSAKHSCPTARVPLFLMKMLLGKGWLELTSKLTMSWHTKTEMIPCLPVPARQIVDLINEMQQCQLFSTVIPGKKDPKTCR
jgi:hypothetical protein